MAPIVVREKFRAVRRHIHRRRTLALASFARQAQVERVLDGRIGETLGQQIGGQSLEQDSRAPARRMDFLARRHVRRAHRARLGLAALPDSDAFERGACESAFAVKVEVRSDFARPIVRAQLQMRVERMRIDNHARIHHRVGIEDALEIAERVDQIGPEHHRQQLRARQPVAVLARERTAETRDQFAELGHRSTERLDSPRARQIEIDARMNASFAEMSVVGRYLEIAAAENAIEAAQKRAEIRGRHGGVLGAGPTARTPRDERARAEPRLANLPDRSLFARVRQVGDAGAFAELACLRDHSLGTLARFVARRATQLDQQKRAPGGQKPHARHLLDSRELGKILVEAFQRFRAMLEQPRRLIRRDKNVVEAEHRQPDFLRARDTSNCRAQNCGERALRANDRARNIEATLRHQLVKIVARHASRQFREMRAHRIRAMVAKLAQAASRARLRGLRARLLHRAARRPSSPTARARVPS